MGRLLKKKIDQIAKLRGEGYTQIEVAEKISVCLKTVRKYDPGSISGSAKEQREFQRLPLRVKKLEEIAKTLSALAVDYQLNKEDEYLVWCVQCDNGVLVEEVTDKRTKKLYYRCSKCGTPIPYARYLYAPLTNIFSEET